MKLIEEDGSVGRLVVGDSPLLPGMTPLAWPCLAPTWPLQLQYLSERLFLAYSFAGASRGLPGVTRLPTALDPLCPLCRYKRGISISEVRTCGEVSGEKRSCADQQRADFRTRRTGWVF